MATGRRSDLALGCQWGTGRNLKILPQASDGQSVGALEGRGCLGWGAGALGVGAAGTCKEAEVINHHLLMVPPPLRRTGDARKTWEAPAGNMPTLLRHEQCCPVGILCL